MDDLPRKGTRAYVRILEEARVLAEKRGPEHLKAYDARLEYEGKRVESRYKARAVKKQVMARAGNRCEICRTQADKIGHIHHVKSVKHGGSAEASNLIFLCPNCHAVTHAFSRVVRSRKGEKPLFDWAVAAFNRETAWFSFLLSVGLLRLEGNEWVEVCS